MRISEFYDLLLNQNNTALTESYIYEFIPSYIKYLLNFSPAGSNVNFTKRILAINEKIISSDVLEEKRDHFITLNFNLKDRLTEIEKVLEGISVQPINERKILFPVIEEDERLNKNVTLGAIDSLTIKINISRTQNRFIVVPSVDDLDKKLEDQINLSWQKAKEYCTQFVKKMNPFHEVIINFDERLGIYKGDSIGTALLIGFIEGILGYYNSQTVLKAIGNAAFTGGVNANGTINQISEEITEKKVEIAFFSKCAALVVPKVDEPSAVKKLEELNREFPNRNLKIIAVKDIEEILLRRDLVEISKQKLTVRTGKFVSKNWQGVVFALLLALIFSYLFALDLDDNPAVIENKGTSLLVKNKNGKILWTTKLWIKLEDNFQYMLSNLAKCMDINADGINEVLICHDDFNDGVYEEGRISCYDYKGNLIWKYNFKDTVRTVNEVHSTTYSIGIVQNNISVNDSIIYCYVSNHPLFPSSIFSLSASTGKRINKGLWNAGHIVNAMIGDFNKDDKLEIVALGVHNGFNSAILFTVDPENLNGQTPTVGDYSFIGLETVRPKTLISFLPCDLTKYHNIRMNSAVGSTLMFDNGSKEFRFLIHEGIDTDCRSVHYRFDKNLKFLSVSPGNGYEEERDMLVRQGKLSPPLTNTKEYEKMLRDKITYWENDNWVHIDTLRK